MIKEDGIAQIDEDGIRQRWERVGSKLDERGRRLWAAGEVQAAGHGALKVVSRITEGTDHYAGATIREAPGGTAVSLFHEVTFGSFGQRIKLPLGVRNLAARIKRQCEKEAATHSRLAELANHWLVLSLLALGSFWYLFSSQDALLIALVIALHELGHAAAMRLVGIPCRAST